jgi:hypothetical protein
MTGKQIAWHLVRLALAVVLLAFDTRVFLFYAFTIVLAVASDTDRLRASVRVLHFRNEAKLLALLTERGLKDADVSKAADEMFAQWTEEQRESLQADMRRSRRDL